MRCLTTMSLNVLGFVFFSPATVKCFDSGLAKLKINSSTLLKWQLTKI